MGLASLGGGGGEIEQEGWYRGQHVFRLRDAMRATALHKVGRGTVGVGVLSAPAGFQTSNPRLGFQRGTRNAQDPPKPTGWYVRGRQIRLSVPLLPLLPFTLFFCFFFHPLPRHTWTTIYSFHCVRTCCDVTRSYLFPCS